MRALSATKQLQTLVSIDAAFQHLRTRNGWSRHSGVSSPCVWGEQIFLTAFSIGKLETLALDRRDGRVRWRQVAPVEKIYRTTESSSPAAPSPATDGKRVYVYFPSFGLLGYGLDGREFWRKPILAVAVCSVAAFSQCLATIAINS